MKRANRVGSTILTVFIVCISSNVEENRMETKIQCQDFTHDFHIRINIYFACITVTALVQIPNEVQSTQNTYFFCKVLN